ADKTSNHPRLSKLVWKKGTVFTYAAYCQAMAEADAKETMKNAEVILARPDQVNAVRDLASAQQWNANVGILVQVGGKPGEKPQDCPTAVMKWLQGLPLSLGGVKMTRAQGAVANKNNATEELVTLRVTMVQRFASEPAWKTSMLCAFHSLWNTAGVTRTYGFRILESADDKARTCFATVQKSKAAAILAQSGKAGTFAEQLVCQHGRAVVEWQMQEDGEGPVAYLERATMLRPRWGRRGWVFKMVPPAGAHLQNTCELRDSTVVKICREVRRQAGMEARPISAKPGFVRSDLVEAGKKREEKAAKAEPWKAQELAAGTQETTGGAAPGEGKRQQQAAAGTEPGAKKAEGIVPDKVLGYKSWDLGGCGGCFYRAVGAAKALLEGETQEAIEKNAEGIGAKLRAETAGLIRAHKLWQDSCFKGDNATPQKEGGPVPDTWDSWVTANARKGGWVDERAASALCLRLERRVVVFLWQAGEWQKAWVFKPPVCAGLERKRAKAMKAAPLPVCLKDEHYFALAPGVAKAEWPIERGEEPEEEVSKQLCRGAGDGADDGDQGSNLHGWFQSDRQSVTIAARGRAVQQPQ
ncbi:unnamed protein product, partial [Prorocentrum cordatum]